MTGKENDPLIPGRRIHENREKKEVGQCEKHHAGLKKTNRKRKNSNGGGRGPPPGFIRAPCLPKKLA